MSDPSRLLDHLDALRSALLRSLAAVALFLIPGVLFAGKLLRLYTEKVLPEGMVLHYFSPFEPVFVELEIGFFLAVLASFPVILYETAKFIAPGLYEKERKAAGLFIGLSLLLMIPGALLALFGVVPVVMSFSGTFVSDGLRPVIGMSAFLKVTMLLTFGFSAIFELPALLLPAIRLGFIKVEKLRKIRPAAIIVIFIAAALLTPPDVVSQLMLGIPAWLLFELTLLIGGRIAPEQEPDEEPEESSDGIPDPQENPSSEEEEREESAPETPPEPGCDYDVYRRAARRRRRIRPL